VTVGIKRDINGSRTGAKASPSISPFISALVLLAFYMN
jgi:hypothetical protein